MKRDRLDAQDALPGVDATMSVELSQLWRVRDSGQVLRTVRYDPSDAYADPTVRATADVEVAEARFDAVLGEHLPDPDTRRVVTQGWLRTHCSYCPPVPPEQADDHGVLERAQRALEDLADAASPAGPHTAR